MQVSFSLLSDTWGNGEKFTIAEMLDVLKKLESSELDQKTKDDYYKFFTELRVKAV